MEGLFLLPNITHLCAMLKIGSKIVSYAFHPLMMMTYGLIMLIVVNPYMFGYGSLMDGMPLILIVWASSFFYPAFATAMLRFTNLIPSIEMEDRMSRVGPMIITLVFYLWLARNFYQDPRYPTIFSAYVLGASLSLMIAFFINLFMKVSLHSIGVSGWLMLTIVMASYFGFSTFTVVVGSGAYQIGVAVWLFGVLLISGLVGTARLALGAHTLEELSYGFLVGLLGQVVAFRILLW